MNEFVTVDFLDLILNSEAISPIIVVDENGIIIYFNKKILDIYGVASDENFIGKHLNNYINITKINEIQLNASKKFKFYIDVQGGKEISLDSIASKVIIKDKVYFILTIENVDKEIEQYDPLTGLYNRAYFKMKLKRIIKNSRNNRSKLAILIIKVKEFRKINERLGFQIGDKILQLIADSLKLHVKSKNIIARIGGSEFCIVLDNLEDYSEATVCASKIINASKKALLVDKLEVKYCIKIGISSFPDTSNDYHELIKHAYFVLQNLSNKEGYKFYSDEFKQNYHGKIDFENKLQNAIKNKELYLVYHPQVNLLNNKIIGLEALLRWDYAELKNINTEKLISIAEESELIGKINKYIIRKLEEDLNIIKKGVKDKKLTIAINFSPHLTELKRNLKEVSNLLTSINKKHENFNFQIELTESSFMEQEITAHEILKQFITEMKSNNIKLCVDDFGMEYSSIKRLLEQNFDVIKIHKSFIEMLQQKDNVTAIAIVRSIISLGNDLSFKVVAEGVEHLAQVNILKALGCHYAQGFYFYRPLSIDNLIKILQRDLT